MVPSRMRDALSRLPYPPGTRSVLLGSAALGACLLPTLLGCAPAAPPAAPETSTTIVSSAFPKEPDVSPTSDRPSTPSATAPGTHEERRARFLAALRDAGVPVSMSGDTETLIAEGVCDRLAAGVPEADLVEDVEAMGGVWTSEHALAVVRSAGVNFCTR